MAETHRNSKAGNKPCEIDLKRMQFRYLVSGLCLLPVSPFLYLQARYTRWKVGRLPDAGGATSGAVGSGSQMLKLLAIGESTVAGIGAKTHQEALTGQFAKHLSRRTSKKIEWHAYGQSGITISKTLKELIPKIPAKEFDVIVVALGANDVFKLNSPEGFRKDLAQLISVLREKNPDAVMFLANVPMIRDFIALPNPLKYVLSRLAKLHHFNAIDLIAGIERAYYYDDLGRVNDDFFSDGIHPSERGYDLWSEAMVDFFYQSAAAEKGTLK